MCYSFAGKGIHSIEQFFLSHWHGNESTWSNIWEGVKFPSQTLVSRPSLSNEPIEFKFKFLLKVIQFKMH